MDKDYFMNAEIPWNGLNNCTAEQSFLEPNMDQFSHFESSLSSGLSNDAFVLRELIGKLGGGAGIGTSTTFAAESHPFTNTTNDSSSLSSPKLNFMGNLVNSVPLTPPPPPLPSLSTDPGFAERAAKFSCFGSRSFNGRTSSPIQPLGLNNGDVALRSSHHPLMGNGKLPRVSSTPSLNKLQNGSNKILMEIPISRPGNGNGNGMGFGSDKKLSKLSGSGANSNEESSVSEQIISGETGSKISNEMSSRKRKVVSKGKPKEDRSTSAKGVEEGEDGNAKRAKAAEIETKNEEETKGACNDESEKQKGNQKPPEPPKDYIHVRARRGQATDSHSLAERVRREKISERMKLLQDLVPGCNKVTGKALMLDEIINYVQSLQRQVEFLSMKLASVNPGLDVNMENLLSKDMFQQNTSLPQQMYPLDSSGPAFYHQQNVQQLHNTNISSGPLVDPLPLDAPNLGIHLPSVDGFNESISQFSAFTEDDLQSIVQMGFIQNPVSFPVPNQTTNMKVER
ncbi:hypothetical protein DH2020_046410 [Rehmannia glutinosa]|uniref:BHLH domain-containing protein n=1 Tax=Rehmannia glutinosa TaxID=99300 RepID=A0ABR0UBM7_REHGL